MTREEVYKRFRKGFRPQVGERDDVVVLQAIGVMVEIMADAIEEMHIHNSVTKSMKSSEMTPEEWDAWWEKTGRLFL
jgi:hypothetical protein